MVVCSFLQPTAARTGNKCTFHVFASVVRYDLMVKFRYKNGYISLGWSSIDIRYKKHVHFCRLQVWFSSQNLDVRHWDLLHNLLNQESCLWLTFVVPGIKQPKAHAHWVWMLSELYIVKNVYGNHMLAWYEGAHPRPCILNANSTYSFILNTNSKYLSLQVISASVIWVATCLPRGPVRASWVRTMARDEQSLKLKDHLH